MTQYTDVFGGSNIYPSDISFSNVNLTADTQFSWPEETSNSGNLISKIMNITGTAAWSLLMPDARSVSPGETVFFNNVGAFTQTVKNSAGTTLLTLAPGKAWQMYLTDNTTAAGTWNSFQFGEGVSEINASSLAGTGIVAIGSLLSQSVPITNFNSNYTSGVNDRARMFVWSGAAGVLTLTSPGVLLNNWFIYVRNSGTGALAVTPAFGQIDSQSSLSFQPGESAIIVTDGSNFFSVGYGRSAVFAFDYLAISAAGTGDLTLTGSQLNRISYKFTGVLTGNRTIIVPATVQQYWVDNSTSGAFSFSIKTAAGSPISIAAGQRRILYCDGVNVIAAESNNISIPLLVSQGGTGSTTASGARIGLGATSVGEALFTAVDQAAAWSALGPAPVGVISGGTF